MTGCVRASDHSFRSYPSDASPPGYNPFELHPSTPPPAAHFYLDRAPVKAWHDTAFWKFFVNEINEKFVSREFERANCCYNREEDSNRIFRVEDNESYIYNFYVKFWRNVDIKGVPKLTQDLN